MRYLSVVRVGGVRKLMFQASVVFQAHLRRLVQEFEALEPISTKEPAKVWLVKNGQGWLVALPREMEEVEEFIRSTWTTWQMMVKEKQEPSNVPARVRKGTLTLPKKKVDPNRLKDLEKRINEQHGHTPKQAIWH